MRGSVGVAARVEMTVRCATAMNCGLNKNRLYHRGHCNVSSAWEAVPSITASATNSYTIERREPILELLVTDTFINSSNSLLLQLISARYTTLPFPSRALHSIEALVRLARPHSRRASAPDEPNVDSPALDLLHLLQRHFTVRAATQDFGSQKLLIVDLVEVGFEGLDALEQLSAAVGAVAAADVAAQLVVLGGAGFVDGFDDDGAVGEAGCTACSGIVDAIAGLGGRGRRVIIWIGLLLVLLLWCSETSCLDRLGLASSSESLDCMPGTAYRDWPDGCCIANVLYAVSQAALGFARDELDLLIASLESLNFLRRHHTIDAALHRSLSGHSIVMGLTQVCMKTTHTLVEFVVGLGAVAVAEVAA